MTTGIEIIIFENAKLSVDFSDGTSLEESFWSLIARNTSPVTKLLNLFEYRISLVPLINSDFKLWYVVSCEPESLGR